MKAIEAARILLEVAKTIERNPEKFREWPRFRRTLQRLGSGLRSCDLRSFYLYDPLPTLQTLNAPLLDVFGELDTLRVSKRMCVRSGKSWIRRDAGITPLRLPKRPVNARHNLMEVFLITQTSMSASNDSHRVSSKRWSAGRQHSFVGVHQ